MKVYAVDRDSLGGSAKHTERCRAIENSRKIIIVLSNSYLANPTCLSEADLLAGNSGSVANIYFSNWSWFLVNFRNAFRTLDTQKYQHF